MFIMGSLQVVYCLVDTAACPQLLFLVHYSCLGFQFVAPTVLGWLGIFLTSIVQRYFS